jgi:ubiquitin carboxyl-terminal hydrolase 9/24
MQQLSFSKVTYHYSYELKPHLDLLFHVIIISDSWQTKPLMLAFNGISKDGLFDIISHYQKRAHQIIKMLVQLFTK